MGIYLNPNFEKFEKSLNSEIYVDKSNLIIQTNALLDTEQRFICLSRPRRFGKTMAANMLAAYYGATQCNLFESLSISKHEGYEKHLNKHNVLMINVQVFLSKTNSMDELLTDLQKSVLAEIFEEYPDITYRRKDDFVQVMNDVYQATKRSFVILLDEWDCLFREYKHDTEAQKNYLDFLRLWLKDQAYVGLAYMTGILPIKKYGSHSALNMFEEYSMTEPSQFINYFGFTTAETEALTQRYNVNFEELKKWYNGYFAELGTPIYSPKSVTSSLMRKRFSSYWNNTETYEALKIYVEMDFDDLRTKFEQLIAGASIEIDVRSFTNDMTTFESADDVLTLLVHLGYLTYNIDNETVTIPNEEVKGEFITSMRTLKWTNIIDSVKNSKKLLEAIWTNDTEFVAAGVQAVHEQNTSIIEYNDENSLSCIISLALYTATEYYTTIRELPTGKGYADIIYIPRKKHAGIPALIVELKWDKSATSAIDQIKQKNYPVALEEYTGNMLLVGINYDKTEKTHECIIETWEK